jgi:hypothetical protein
MEITRNKFNNQDDFFLSGGNYCSCSMGVQHGWFQMEMFGECNEEEFGFSRVKVEEGQFSFITAQHGLDIFVVEIVVETVDLKLVVDFDRNCHRQK